MTLEAPEMQQQTIGAKEKYLQSQSNFAMAKERYQRLLVALATVGAISPYNLSSAKATMQADSALSNAQKMAWLMQETVQGYWSVIAPFNGIITQRNVHPGTLVNAVDKSAPMLELKSIKHLRFVCKFRCRKILRLHSTIKTVFILPPVPCQVCSLRAS